MPLGIHWTVTKQTGTSFISFSEDIEEGKRKKKGMRFSQDSNLHLLNGGQMFLPSEPLELWQWSSGFSQLGAIYGIYPKIQFE